MHFFIFLCTYSSRQKIVHLDFAYMLVFAHRILNMHGRSSKMHESPAKCVYKYEIWDCLEQVTGLHYVIIATYTYWKTTKKKIGKQLYTQ